MQEQRPFPSLVEIVVEIPRGNRNKDEYDGTTGVFHDVLRADRKAWQLEHDLPTE